MKDRSDKNIASECKNLFAKLLSNPSLLQASLGLGLAPHSLSSGTAMTATGNPTSLGTPLGPIIQVRCPFIPSRSPLVTGDPVYMVRVLVWEVRIWVWVEELVKILGVYFIFNLFLRKDHFASLYRGVTSRHSSSSPCGGYRSLFYGLFRRSWSISVSATVKERFGRTFGGSGASWWGWELAALWDQFWSRITVDLVLHVDVTVTLHVCDRSVHAAIVDLEIVFFVLTPGNHGFKGWESSSGALGGGDPSSLYG